MAQNIFLQVAGCLNPQWLTGAGSLLTGNWRNREGEFFPQ
jgi:hypothetical protein